MRRKVSDYIADVLSQNGVTDIFTVVGGGAMHLNDSFGNCREFHCTYNHHEQACAMAAESYARVNGQLAVACVTTGPGGTNAITGVLCSWQDNIPLLVISGQVRTNTMVASTGLDLRQYGEQEHYIVDTVKGMTKYAVTVKTPEDILYELEKCIYLATTGRRGPCWLDIPLDIQGAYIETDNLIGYSPEEKQLSCQEHMHSIKCIIERLRNAKRPVIVAGSAIRSTNTYSLFERFVNEWRIPVLAANGCNDLMPVCDELYYGNFGMIGGRTGNFMVQNADVILVLGCRMTFKHIGFNYEEFSPNSYKIVIDIDENELRKKLMRIDFPVQMDLQDFFEQMLRSSHQASSMDVGWLEYCNELREKFPIYQEKFNTSESVNPYYFAEKLKEAIPSDGIIVVGNSCACDCVRQCGIAAKGQRLWGNTNCGTMGYDLPAAIGAAVAAQKDIYCVTGDGSIQMNLQELQTIVHNKLPIKIFIHNNASYYAIVQTHSNFFGRLSGCTEDSGISFPDFEKLAYAYGIQYFKVASHNELDEKIKQVVEWPGNVICEIVSDVQQPIEPKVKSRINADGSIASPKLDDLFPYIPDEIYQKYSNYFSYIESKGENK